MRQFGFCLSALLLGASVNAQDLLQPLLVTGQREFESDEELVERGNVDFEVLDAQRLDDLLGHVPGLASVSSDSGGFGDTLAVRGSANTLFFGGPGVGLVVDDVPFGDVFTYPTDFFDLESFTLHRGPQAGRFARNGAGGLIEVKTAGPSDTPEFSVSAEYGSFDSLNLRLRATGPINDKWSYAFQSFYKERDGFIDNVNPLVGGSNDTREKFGALGSLYYKPSEDLEVRFRALYERTRDGSQRLTALPGVASAFGPLDFLRAQNSFEVASDLEGETEIDRLQFSLHLDQDLGWANLKSISSYQRWELGPNTVDLDLSPQPASTSAINQEQTLWGQEFRLESDESKSVRWTAGVAYLRKDTEGDATRFFGTSQFTFANQTTTFDTEEDNVSFFANVHFDATENLTFEVGGRLEYVETSLRRSRIDTGNTPGFPAVVPAIIGESDGLFFSPSLGVNYDFQNGVSLFGRTSLSFKPQGFTAFSDNPNQASFDEEFAWETELGLRYQNSAQSFGYELRGYYKRIDDYQLNVSVPFTTDFIIANADRVDAFGFEGEIFWKPVDRFTIRATAGWNQIEFGDYTSLTGDDLSGNDVPFIPQFTASLGMRYDFESGFFVQSSLRVVGETYFDDTNNRDFREGSYHIWDAQIGYQAENWNIALFARNLLDEEHFTFINNQIAAGAPGDPQVLGVRVGLEF